MNFKKELQDEILSYIDSSIDYTKSMDIYSENSEDLNEIQTWVDAMEYAKKGIKEIFENYDKKDFTETDSKQDREKVSHYNQYSFGETKDIMYEVSSYYPPTVSPAISNIIKYVLRAPFKGTPLKDIIKARDYINDSISEMKQLSNDDVGEEQLNKTYNFFETLFKEMNEHDGRK